VTIVVPLFPAEVRKNLRKQEATFPALVNLLAPEGM